MRRLVWFFGWVGVALWSLLCLLTYGFLDIVGRLIMGNADMMSSNPETVEGIWRVLSWLHSASTGAVVVIWAIVSLLILAVPWVLDRALGATPSPAGRRSAAQASRFGGNPGVIDLGPDQYSVRPTSPAQSAPSGPAPRIGPQA